MSEGSIPEGAKEQAASLGNKLRDIGTQYTKASGAGKAVMIGGSVAGVVLAGDGARRAWNSLEKDEEGKRNWVGVVGGVVEAGLGVAATAYGLKKGGSMVKG